MRLRNTCDTGTLKLSLPSPKIRLLPHNRLLIQINQIIYAITTIHQNFHKMIIDMSATDFIGSIPFLEIAENLYTLYKEAKIKEYVRKLEREIAAEIQQQSLFEILFAGFLKSKIREIKAEGGFREAVIEKKTELSLKKFGIDMGFSKSVVETDTKHDSKEAFITDFQDYFADLLKFSKMDEHDMLRRIVDRFPIEEQYLDKLRELNHMDHADYQAWLFPWK